MKLTLNKAVFQQLCRMLDASRDKFTETVLLIGRRQGERIVIESARRTARQRAPSMDADNVVGLMFFRPERRVFVNPDDRCRLLPLERHQIKSILRERKELAAVVTVIERGGDLTFYPAYFSRSNPRGVDMALEYEGSTVCQQYSALGGCCRAPHETEIEVHNNHRQIPVKVQGRWIAIDRNIGRLVRLVNQIPGIFSTMSCQGGRPNVGKSRRCSNDQAYLELAPQRYAAEFFVLMHLDAVATESDPRLEDITRRLRLKFEQRLGMPLAVTRARRPFEVWKREGVPKMYPKLRQGKLLSFFRWDPKETPKLLASVEDLLKEEAARKAIRLR